jgi:hypothetical protein
LFFAEPGDTKPTERVFSVGLQGEEVIRDLDIVKTAGARMRGITREFRGIKIGRALELSFTAKSGRPIISGVELMLDL